MQRHTFYDGVLAILGLPLVAAQTIPGLDAFSYHTLTAVVVAAVVMLTIMSPIWWSKEMMGWL